MFDDHHLINHALLLVHFLWLRSGHRRRKHTKKLEKSFTQTGLSPFVSYRNTWVAGLVSTGTCEDTAHLPEDVTLDCFCFSNTLSNTSSHLLMTIALFTYMLERSERQDFLTSGKLPHTDIQTGKDTFKRSLKEALTLTE